MSIESWSIEKDRNSMSGLSAYETEKNGGAGSGNFGHAGRPGKRGGSAPEGSLVIKDKGDGGKDKGGDGKKYGKYSRSKTYTRTGRVRRHSDGSLTTDSDYEPETYRDIAKAQGVTQTVSEESYTGKFDGIDGTAKDVGGAQATLALQLQMLGEKLLDAGNTKGKFLKEQLKEVDGSLATAEQLFADYNKATAKGQRHDISSLVGGTPAQIKAIQARDKALKEVLKTFQDATKKAHKLKPNETDEAYHKDIEISDVWKF